MKARKTQNLLSVGCAVLSQLAAVAVLCPCYGAEQRFPVKPMRMYRAEKATDIQFYDAEGRALFLGAYPNAKFVAAPLDAASANVKLEALELDGGKGVPIDDPAFWCETSKVEENSGDRVKVLPGGYALSGFVPAIYEYKCEKEPEGPKPAFWECMQRLWYDRDLHELARSCSHHLGAYAAPTNAAYVRFLIPWCRYDHFRDQRLNRAFFLDNSNHPLKAKRGVDDAEIWKRLTPPVWHPGEIVLGANPDCRALYAASELVRKTKLITGKTLPLVAAPTKGAAFRIWMGREAAVKGLGEEATAKVLQKLKGTDGYVIHRKDKDIYLFGGRERGVIFAAAKLIELVSDFCWWRPQQDVGMSFTPQKTLDFASVKTFGDRPVFQHRTFFVGCCPVNYAFDDWAAHHGLTRCYGVDRVFTVEAYHAKAHGFNASIGANFINLALHGHRDHEEFWPMVNGKRQVDADGQPCYSNPEVVKATLENVNRILDDAPDEWDQFGFNYADSWLCCECPECQKPIKLPQGGELECHSMLAGKDPVFRSTRTYMVANEIAKAVTARYPEKPVEMLAYIYTAAPPAVKLHPAIRVLYATYASGTMRFPSKDQTWPSGEGRENVSWATRTERWCSREPQAMGMYEYYSTPAPGLYAEACAENLKQMADVGGTWHVHTESGEKGRLWDVNAVEQVLIAQLFWNPYRDVNALREDLLRRIYGKGADDLLEFYKLFAPHWFDIKFRTWMNCHTPPADVYTEFVIKQGLEKKLYACLERAHKKAPSAAAKRQVRQMTEAFREMKVATGRTDIPHVSELTRNEWQKANSTQWNKAYTVPEFRDALPDPSDPAQMTCDLVKTPPAVSKTKTKVDFACDKNYLYWRVTPDKNGGYTELRFLIGKYNERHSFYATADGVKTGRIPFGAILRKPDDPIFYIALRYDAKGNLSFGRGNENKTRGCPGASTGGCSKLIPEVTPVLDEKDAKVGEKAQPPMTFPADPELADHPLKKLFPFCGRGGEAMRRVRGVPVYDTGFGGGTKRFPAKPGDAFTVTGDRWRYGGYAAIGVSFFDEKGQRIRQTHIDLQQAMRDGPFEFKFTCPDKTATFDLFFYNTYLKKLEGLEGL